MGKATDAKIVCQNKKAFRDYFIEKKIEAGIMLMGSEVKSLRVNGAQLVDSYVDLRTGEVKLYNMHISPWQYATHEQHPSMRVRKLLLHKAEIKKLDREVKQQGLTIIPLKVYFKGSLAKVELGLAKGKKNYDKREDLKKKDHQREMSRFNKAK